MNLVQQLLLRALIARFWETPYEGELVRWGTSLHDRFLLPHFLKADLGEVLADLRRAGFAFDDGWFAPHFEFRFPAHGTVRFGEVEIELRHALECWNTLGEEPGGGGTARYVDSSLERMQIKVTGLTPGKHLVTVGGRRLPLTPTGTQNAPAPPEATGLEVDKMNRVALRSHFEAYVGNLISRLPAADRKSWKPRWRS